MANVNQLAGKRPRAVIIGGGFAGLYAAKLLGGKEVDVTLIDRRNFHLFQPLLYQVATGGLSPGDIASPLRAIFSRQKNINVMYAEVCDIDPFGRKVILNDSEISYDFLIIASGATHHYFGHDDWIDNAPGLKTIEDAVAIRSRVFYAFEAAEREPDPVRREAWTTFVIVGGGPTGVELAGALGELCRQTLMHDFRVVNPVASKIYLVEGHDRLLPGYPPFLSRQAVKSLRRLGVTVINGAYVTALNDSQATVKAGGDIRTISARTILWAAGVTSSPLGKILAAKTGAQLDRIGRVMVSPDLTIPKFDNIYVVGDLANIADRHGQPLPGVAPVAMQEGRYAARHLRHRLIGRDTKPFHYFNKGNLAVIGRNAAVADFGKIKIWGFFAWIVWIFVHIGYLIEFDNKLLVLIQWGWDYFTRKRGARLISGAEAGKIAEKILQPPPGAQVREHVNSQES